MRPAASGGSTCAISAAVVSWKERRRRRVFAVGDHGLARIDVGGEQLVRGQRGRDDLAAENLAGRGERVEPSRRHFLQHRERRDDAFELVELAIEESTTGSRSDRIADDFGDLDVTRAQILQAGARAFDVARRRQSPPRRAGDRSRSTAPTRRRPARAHRRPPSALRPAAPRARGDQPLNGGLIGDRRAAELHHYHSACLSSQLSTFSASTSARFLALAISRSNPSACISSALRIAAPAAPRTVL